MSNNEGDIGGRKNYNLVSNGSRVEEPEYFRPAKFYSRVGVKQDGSMVVLIGSRNHADLGFVSLRHVVVFSVQIARFLHKPTSIL